MEHLEWVVSAMHKLSSWTWLMRGRCRSSVAVDRLSCPDGPFLVVASSRYVSLFPFYSYKARSPKMNPTIPVKYAVQSTTDQSWFIQIARPTHRARAQDGGRPPCPADRCP